MTIMAGRPLRRRLEHGEVAESAGQGRHLNELITGRGEFADQEFWRRPVRLRGAVQLLNPQTSARFERRRQGGQQRHRLLDLVIHVDHDGGVDRTRRQPWIAGRP